MALNRSERSLDGVPRHRRPQGPEFVEEGLGASREEMRFTVGRHRLRVLRGVAHLGDGRAEVVAGDAPGFRLTLRTPAGDLVEL